MGSLSNHISHLEKHIASQRQQVVQIFVNNHSVHSWERFEYALKFVDLKPGKQLKERQKVDDEFVSKARHKSLHFSDDCFWKATILHLENLRQSILSAEEKLEDMKQYASRRDYHLHSPFQAYHRKEYCKTKKSFAKYDLENRGAVYFRNKTDYLVFRLNHYDCKECEACDAIRNNTYRIDYPDEE